MKTVELMVSITTLRNLLEHIPEPVLVELGLVEPRRKSDALRILTQVADKLGKLAGIEREIEVKARKKSDDDQMETVRCVLGDPPKELWPNMDKENKRLRNALKKIEDRTNDPVALSIAGEALVD